VSDEDPDDSDYASISGESSACESSVASECDDQVSIHSYQHEAHDASLVQEVDYVMFDENIDPGVLPAQLSSNASVTSEHEDVDDDGENVDINEEDSADLESEQAPAADTGRYPQR
jgi:hypothetical protein